MRANLLYTGKRSFPFNCRVVEILQVFLGCWRSVNGRDPSCHPGQHRMDLINIKIIKNEEKKSLWSSTTKMHLQIGVSFSVCRLQRQHIKIKQESVNENCGCEVCSSSAPVN